MVKPLESAIAIAGRAEGVASIAHAHSTSTAEKLGGEIEVLKDFRARVEAEITGTKAEIAGLKQTCESIKNLVTTLGTPQWQQGVYFVLSVVWFMVGAFMLYDRIKNGPR